LLCDRDTLVGASLSEINEKHIVTSELFGRLRKHIMVFSSLPVSVNSKTITCVHGSGAIFLARSKLPTRDLEIFYCLLARSAEIKNGADVDFQAVWAHASNQEHQGSPRGASDWWRESVRKSVSVYQDKIRGSAIYLSAISVA